MSWENTVRPSFIDHSFRMRGMAVEYRKLQIDYDRFHLQSLRTWPLTQNFMPNVRTLLISNLQSPRQHARPFKSPISNLQISCHPAKPHRAMRQEPTRPPPKPGFKTDTDKKITQAGAFWLIIEIIGAKWTFLKGQQLSVKSAGRMVSTCPPVATILCAPTVDG